MGGSTISKIFTFGRKAAKSRKRERSATVDEPVGDTVASPLHVPSTPQPLPPKGSAALIQEINDLERNIQELQERLAYKKTVLGTLPPPPNPLRQRIGETGYTNFVPIEISPPKPLDQRIGETGYGVSIPPDFPPPNSLSGQRMGGPDETGYAKANKLDPVSRQTPPPPPRRTWGRQMPQIQRETNAKPITPQQKKLADTFKAKWDPP